MCPQCLADRPPSREVWGQGEVRGEEVCVLGGGVYTCGGREGGVVLPLLGGVRVVEPVG